MRSPKKVFIPPAEESLYFGKNLEVCSCPTILDPHQDEATLYMHGSESPEGPPRGFLGLQGGVCTVPAASHFPGKLGLILGMESGIWLDTSGLLFLGVQAEVRPGLGPSEGDVRPNSGNFGVKCAF